MPKAIVITPPLSNNTDRHICKFLLSPFEPTGWGSYKRHYKLEFSEPSRQITNRLAYLKKLQRNPNQFIKFAHICNKHGVSSSVTKFRQPKYDSDESNYSETDSDTDTDSDLDTPITYRPTAKTRSTPPREKPTQTTHKKSHQRSKEMPSYKSNSKDPDMRHSHQHDLNFEFPHLNFNGMMWFRDDDVLIGNSLHSILTIYQPLYDPRDFHDIKLCFDIDDPDLVRLYHPNIPTYMHKDLESMHSQEMKTDPKNSELYSFTAKKHKKAAIKAAASDRHKMQVTECHLPFSVTNEQFSNIDNTGGEAEKNYRKIEVKVTDKIKDTCSYIFWKILIKGETTHLKSKRRTVRNQFDEAEERMSKMSLS